LDREKIEKKFPARKFMLEQVMGNYRNYVKIKERN